MRTIDTFCGSITDCQADVIVNSSNSQVALGSGVSGAIRDACGGEDFQLECREALDDQFDGYLPLGNVVFTSGGHCRFRWILHAAIIDFSKGPRTTVNVVRSSMINCLKSSEQIIEEQGLDTLSLGVPLFGSDVGGLSIQESCVAMSEGMKSYFRSHRDSLINKICFVHPDHNVIRQIKMILSRHFILSS